MSSTLRALVALVLIATVCSAPLPAAAAHGSRHHATKSQRVGAHRLSDGGSRYLTSLPSSATTTRARATVAGTGGVSAPGTTATPAAPGGSTGPNGPTGATGASAATTLGGSGGSGVPRGSTGGGPTGPTAPPTAPPVVAPARILASGLAVAPAGAPAAVQAAIAAGNELIGKPYIYGGGHKSFIAAGYDCSGAVSYALHGADLLAAPLDSGELASWGLPSAGTWMSVYANPQHTYLDIASIRLDTSRVDDPHGQSGPRWRPLRLSSAGYVVRHPAGL